MIVLFKKKKNMEPISPRRYLYMQLGLTLRLESLGANSKQTPASHFSTMFSRQNKLRLPISNLHLARFQFRLRPQCVHFDPPRAASNGRLQASQPLNFKNALTGTDVTTLARPAHRVARASLSLPIRRLQWAEAVATDRRAAISIDTRWPVSRRIKIII